MIILILILLVSLALNVLLSWYSLRSTKQLLFVSENVTELHERLEEFDGHIKFLYELEMFYGDETIKNLIRHSRDLLKYMKQYRGIEELSGQDADDTQEQDENESEESAEENVQESGVQVSPRGKTVFYQAT